MKGILNKTEQGWVVEHEIAEKTPIGYKSWWGKFPLHPEFIEMMDTCFTSKFTQQVEFEFVTEWENGEVGVNGLTYAKLITPNKLDLNKIESKIDEVLANETPEKLLGWMWKDIEKEDSMNFICQDPDCPHCVEEINQMRDNDDAWDQVIDQLGDTNEMIDHIGEVNEMVCAFEPRTDTSSATICKHCGKEKFMHNHVPDAGKMVSNVEIGKKRWDDWDEFNKKACYPEDYQSAFADGFTRGAKWVNEIAKETLYTEEQVMAIVEKSRATGLTAEYIIQSLKQQK